MGNDEEDDDQSSGDDDQNNENEGEDDNEDNNDDFDSNNEDNSEDDNEDFNDEDPAFPTHRENSKLSLMHDSTKTTVGGLEGSDLNKAKFIYANRTALLKLKICSKHEFHEKKLSLINLSKNGNYFEIQFKYQKDEHFDMKETEEELFYYLYMILEILRKKDKNRELMNGDEFINHLKDIFQRLEGKKNSYDLFIAASNLVSHLQRYSRNKNNGTLTFLKKKMEELFEDSDIPSREKVLRRLLELNWNTIINNSKIGREAVFSYENMEVFDKILNLQKERKYLKFINSKEMSDNDSHLHLHDDAKNRIAKIIESSEQIFTSRIRRLVKNLIFHSDFGDCIFYIYCFWSKIRDFEKIKPESCDFTFFKNRISKFDIHVLPLDYRGIQENFDKTISEKLEVKVPNSTLCKTIERVPPNLFFYLESFIKKDRKYK